MYNLRTSITNACKKAGMTKRELSFQLSVSDNQIQIWQRKNIITMTNAARIAQATNMSLSEFIALGEE